LSFFTDPINNISNWLLNLLTGWGLPAGLASFLLSFIGAVIYCVALLVFVFFLIWVERKIIARMQDRVGPNRVGPFGILQSIPDAIKIFTKEYITPVGVDRVIYNLAPVLEVASVMFVWAVVPLYATWTGADLNIAVLYVIAVGEIGILMIMMAGWSSNNKYALLGSFRTAAQLISYEVPMVLTLLIPVFLSRSMGMNGIIHAQESWFILQVPLAFIIFFIVAIAEVGRAPFDLMEAESEIVAGYHIEYSGLKFGMFYVGEFLHAFTISALAAILFLGGWRGPGAEAVPILGIGYFFIKTFLLYCLTILIRGTLPRLRIDQMMNFNWKVLTPVIMLLLVVTVILDYLMAGMSIYLRTGVFMVINIILGLAALQIFGRFARPKPNAFINPIPGTSSQEQNP
jgi:NADH-quinone oxidoreductase subunit H